MTKGNKLAYKFFRIIFKPILYILYHPTIIGRENIPATGKLVIAGNHMHAFDPILVDVSTKRIVCTLAKKALHDGKFGFFFRAIGSIPVDLENDSLASLTAAFEVLDEEGAVNLSPEGTRNYTDELLLPFKYGSVILAKKAKAPIVPYAIVGEYKTGAKNLKIIYGKPFSVEKMKLVDANRELYNQIKDLMVSNADEAFLATKHISTFDEANAKNKA